MIYKGEFTTEENDTLYPHTSADVVFLNNGVNLETRVDQLNKYIGNVSKDTNTALSRIYTNEIEIYNLKTSVSDGKNLIATAITDKGVITSGSDSFSTMADNISKIGLSLTALEQEKMINHIKSLKSRADFSFNTNILIDDTPEDYEVMVYQKNSKFLFMPNPRSSVGTSAHYMYRITGSYEVVDSHWIDNYGSLYQAWELIKINSDSCKISCNYDNPDLEYGYNYLYRFTILDPNTILKRLTSII